jgi:hypothetical protein
MLARDWLGPGLEIVSQRATRAVKSYARDQLKQGQRFAITWAAGAGLFVIAAVFSVGLVIVGLIALFSFLRLHLGLFQSYGIIAALIFSLVLSLSAAAMWLLRRPASRFPSLTSRLRVATHAPPPAGDVPNAPASMISVPNRSALLFAAAAVVLTAAVVVRR